MRSLWISPFYLTCTNYFTDFNYCHQILQDVVRTVQIRLAKSFAVLHLFLRILFCNQNQPEQCRYCNRYCMLCLLAFRIPIFFLSEITWEHGKTFRRYVGDIFTCLSILVWQLEKGIFYAIWLVWFYIIINKNIYETPQVWRNCNRIRSLVLFYVDQKSNMATTTRQSYDIVP